MYNANQQFLNRSRSSAVPMYSPILATPVPPPWTTTRREIGQMRSDLTGLWVTLGVVALVLLVLFVRRIVRRQLLVEDNE
jgi:tetrahydromethanopterin S-methyltransferase subunit B